MTDRLPRIRKLMCSCIGFSSSVLFMVLAATRGIWWLLCFALMAASAAALYFLKFRALALFLLAGMLSAVVAFEFREIIWEAPKRNICDTLYRTFTLRCTGFSESFGEYGRVTASVLTCDGKRMRFDAVVYLEDGSPDHAPGDILEVTASAKMTDRGGYLARSGILMSLSTSGGTVTLGRSHSLKSLASLAARAVRGRIEELFPERTASLLSALLCGDRSLMDRDTRLSLQRSGTYHVTAVSGLHVSMISMFLVFVLGKKKGSLAALVLLPAYAFLVGLSPSVIRAVIMTLVSVAGFLLSREYDSLTALFSALAFLLLINPWSALAPGLLLSFSSTLGIILFASRLSDAVMTKIPKKPDSGIVRGAVSSFSVSLCALCFSLPVSMLFFKNVSAVSVFSNVIGVWAIGIFMMLGVFVLLVSLVSFGAAHALAFIPGAIGSAFLWIMGLISRFPMSVMGAGALYFAAICLASAFFIVRGLRNGEWLPAGLVFLGVIVLCAFCTFAENTKAQTLRVYSVRGGCAICVSKGGSNVLVGCDSLRYVSMIFDDDPTAECEALVLLNGRTSRESARGVCAELEPTCLLSPERDDMGIPGQTAYSEGGRVSFSNCDVELLPDGTGAFGAYITCAAGTVLDLCGTSVLGIAINNELRRADAVIVDMGCIKTIYTLRRVLDAVAPGVLVIADTDGYSEYPSVVFDGTVVRLSQKTFSLSGR